MPPEVAVVDAEPETNRVNVGQHRAQCASGPDAFWNLRAVEAGADAQGCDSVGECGCDLGNIACGALLSPILVTVSNAP
jgi:hypothetical protein